MNASDVLIFLLEKELSKNHQKFKQHFVTYYQRTE